MIRLCRTVLLAVALFSGSGAFAFADEAASSAEHLAPTAIGEWTGEVSWSETPVTYGWQINADGTFSSGRLGRGYSGGGAWSAEGSHVWLKYDDGFRYEGELGGDVYAGTAYGADGRVFGTFSMWRDVKPEGDDALGESSDP